MTCGELERWLDAGLPATEARAARVHADSCPRCAASLRAAVELEARMRAAIPAAPAAFTMRVMERVARLESRRRIFAAAPPAMSWWVRAAADPAAALAMALAAVWLWRGDAWRAAASSAAVRLAGIVREPALRPLPPLAGSRPELELGLTLVALPLLALGSWLLFGWTARLVSGGLGVATPKGRT